MSERDIVDVLRAISGEHGDQLGVAECQEAADEITRLRAEVERLRLADAERDAVKWFAKFGNASLATLSNAWADHAATLRALLARHTDHDAAPAARAKAGDGTGDTPTLTVAEREAVATASRIAGAVGESDVKAALRALLARLGGAS